MSARSGLMSRTTEFGGILRKSTAKARCADARQSSPDELNRPSWKAAREGFRARCRAIALSKTHEIFHDQSGEPPNLNKPAEPRLKAQMLRSEGSLESQDG